MRVNIYAEELTDRMEIVSKTIEGHEFTGLRFYLELPVSVPERKNGQQAFRQVRGPFIHHPGDDDSAAVTFWGKQDLRAMLIAALNILDTHYQAKFVSAIRPPVGSNCPSCHSPQPHLHPAVQFEGEVSICPDPFHAKPEKAEGGVVSPDLQRIAELAREHVWEPENWESYERCKGTTSLSLPVEWFELCAAIEELYGAMPLEEPCDNCGAKTVADHKPDCEEKPDWEREGIDCRALRCDAVVDAAVAWHQSGQEGDNTWFDKGEALGLAIDRLLAMRCAE